MSNIKIFENKNFGEVRTLKREDQVWFAVIDICKLLNLSNPSDVVKRIKKINFGKFDLKGRIGMTNFVNKKGLQEIVLNSKKPEAKILAKEIGLKMITTKEQDTLETIINSISGIVEYKTQFGIDGYKIDLYLPKLNIAIECDELNHQRSCNKSLYSVDKVREKNIAQKMRCEFIRFNPDNPKFNIGKIINQIFKEVLKRESTARIS